MDNMSSSSCSIANFQWFSQIYVRWSDRTSTFSKIVTSVYVRELHNILVSDPNDSGIKDSRYEDGKVIISDSTLCSLLPPQLKQMSARYKIMCGC